MACTALKAKAKPCINNIGGVTQFSYIDEDDITDYTINSTSKKYDGFTVANPAVTVHITDESVGFTADEKIDLAEGSVYYETTLPVSLKGATVENIELSKVASEGSRKIAVLLKLNSGDYFLLRSMQKTVGQIVVGATMAAGNKVDFTLLGKTEYPPIQVDSSAVADLFTP